ncbi:hypothetical protein NDU88_004204 [Pleurodeles waltl]|uniref:Uncharacterized protein n=1 Tax=Pleurodeles waltl TaxID=8319 RepID=A0AAV7QH40_PLEWA|nr:hypothetical protein NDU88_004204 [Pleurodeles waltl]
MALGVERWRLELYTYSPYVATLTTPHLCLVLDIMCHGQCCLKGAAWHAQGPDLSLACPRSTAREDDFPDSYDSRGRPSGLTAVTPSRCYAREALAGVCGRE